MSKFYKLGDQVFAFEADGSQDDFIQPEMTVMSEEDIDRHLNPHNYLTDVEKQALYISTLTPLTRRQFKLALLANNLLELIDNTIASISDPLVKALITIEYTEATEFVRTSDGVKYMLNILDLTEEQANTIWEQALTL